MPLSEHEQRLFEQIERSLAEDTKFASAVRSTDPRFHARRRVILAVVAVLLGLAMLVFGVSQKWIPLGVAGFVVMFASAVFGIQSFRRGRSPEIKAVGGKATRRVGGGARRMGFLRRLEDRWQNRSDGDQQS